VTNVRDNLEALVKDQRELMARAEANQKLIERLGRQVQKICDERLKAFQVKVLGSLNAGSATSTWEPSVYVCAHYVGDRTFTKISGRWTWYQGYLGGSDAYAHKLLEGIKFPFDPAALEAACQELTDELGIPVQLSEHKLVGKPERLKTTDDLLASMPGSEVIAQGKIWHMGWDISDPWAVVRAPDGLHCFYATNGHGFGYDVHLGPQDSRQGFLDYLEAEGIRVDGLTPEIRDLVRG